MQPGSTKIVGNRLECVSLFLLRYSMVFVIGYLGIMKFTVYETDAMGPLVVNTPLLAGVYNYLGARIFFDAIGLIEVIIALMVALRPFSVLLSALGSASAAVMFLISLSFMLSGSIWEASLGGFPYFSIFPGQFLLKDLVLFSASLVLFGETLRGVTLKCS